jgi:hypothetical protein
VSRIRPLEREDVPAVADLFESVERSGRPVAPPGLAPYFENSLFDHPWADAEIPSLVYLDNEERVAGFLGSHVRRFRFGARRIRVAFGGQLVAHPRVRNEAAGTLLIRQYLSGPQELTVTDTASETVRRIWQRFGAEQFYLAGIGWVRVFGPTRFAAEYLAGRRNMRLLRTILSPVSRLVDSALTPLPSSLLHPRRPPDLSDAPLTPPALLKHLKPIAESLHLYPDYDEEFLEYLFSEMASVVSRGALVHQLVENSARQVLGWYVYYLRRGGISQVLQVAAPEQHVDEVVDQLFYNARAAGSAALQGRLEPLLVGPLSRRRCVLHFSTGYLVLLCSRVPDLVQAIVSGRALLTRMEGEWWMGHGSEPFDRGAGRVAPHPAGR